MVTSGQGQRRGKGHGKAVSRGFRVFFGFETEKRYVLEAKFEEDRKLARVKACYRRVQTKTCEEENPSYFIDGYRSLDS